MIYTDDIDPAYRTSALYLVLRLVICPLCGICIRPLRHHPFCAHSAAVFATSLLYWRNPIRNSWRRKLDIAVVSTGLSHHMYYALTSPGTHTPATTHNYLALIGMSMTSYIVSQYYSYHRLYWPAAYTHASIHLFANIANVVLYYGVNKYI